MTDLKTYSSKSNAKRAAKGLFNKFNEKDISDIEPVQTDEGDWTLHIHFHVAAVTLTPEQVEAVAAFRATYPAKPSPPRS